MPSITFTTDAATAQRLATALGKAWNLMDNQVPPQPRDATAAEIKLFGIQAYKRLVNDIEGQALQQAALAAAVPPDTSIA